MLRAARVVWIAAPLALMACGGGKSAADRQFDELRTQISKLQADQDRFGERLGALESADDKRREDDPRQGVSARKDPDGDRPKLRVVHVTPDGATTEEEAPPADAADPPGDPRPVIRAGRNGGAVQDGAGATADPADAKRQYEQAMSLVKAKKYDRAIEAFAGFLVRYPDHPNADNALYWRGECFYAKGEYAKAAEQFEGVVARFATGNKVPDALLKAALCHDKLGEKDRTRELLAKLRADYPKSEAAQKAPRE